MKKPIKVLVVDDEKGIRFLLEEVLLHRGFEVSLAKDGQESLEKLEENHFDLVVTDINMPRLDGVSMLKSMHETGREEKVIIMTGNPSDQRLLDEDMPQVVTRLSKPFGMETFLNVVIAATMQSKETAGSKQTRATQYM
ncbi:MAG: response regulator [Deltaproteobacteria bacterium]|jgi:DNA-binding NtrC family response regulator|nr:response regulator [Deltaproteobacteria bacterium]